MARLLGLFLSSLAFSGCALIYDLDPLDMGGCRSTACDGGRDMSGAVDSGCSTACDGGADLSPMCQDDSECPASAPVCTDGKCGSCASAADGGDSAACLTHHSTTPMCGPQGACVQCLSPVDCEATNQTCNAATFTCGACTSNADCTTGVCKAGGVCASAGEVAYVDNAAGCSDLKHASTPAAPYCKIADPLTLDATLHYIVVAPSATSYDAISINATVAAVGPVSIIGPGHNAPTTAKVAPTTGPAVSLATSGSAATLTIDGLELEGAGGGSPAAGAKCTMVTSGAPSLTIVNSYIHSSGLYGVDASSCALTLDANIVAQNSGGGLSVNGGSFAASNNLIVGNGPNGPGALFIGSVSGVWWFNTVAGNHYTNGAITNPGAFSCAAASTVPTLQASIVWGNDKSSGASSDSAKCSFAYSDVDDSTTPIGAGNFDQDPGLTGGTLPSAGYRIPVGSTCSNKVTAATGLSGGTLPSHDVDGRARPRSATGGYDCGGAQAP